MFDVDTNLGRVGDIVPVWWGEVKLALQDLFKKGLLVITTAANIEETGINDAQRISGLKMFKGSILDPLWFFCSRQLTIEKTQQLYS